MIDRNIWKRTTSLILIVTMLLMSFSVPNSAWANGIEYDFSDAAQAQFDAQEYIIINNTPDGLSIETTQKEKKKRRKKDTTEQSTNSESAVNVDSSQLPNVQQKDIAQNSNMNNLTVFETQDSMLKGQVVYVTAGAGFVAILQSSISSASLVKGDTIAAVLQDDWYHNGVLIAPQGSIVYGSAVDASKAGGGYGNGSLSITFNELLTPKGDKLLLTSNVVEIVVAGKRWWKVAANVVGGALIGAVLLASVGQRDNKISTGTIIGAGLGGVAGGIRAATQKGEEVEIPAGTAINVRLTQPMNAIPYEDML